MPELWLLVGPSLVGTAIETIGLALELLGLGRQEKSFLTISPLWEKCPGLPREGKTSGVILVGKYRDRGRISHDVTRWCIVAGSET